MTNEDREIECCEHTTKFNTEDNGAEEEKGVGTRLPRVKAEKRENHSESRQSIPIYTPYDKRKCKIIYDRDRGHSERQEARTRGSSRLVARSIIHSRK